MLTWAEDFRKKKDSGQTLDTIWIVIPSGLKTVLVVPFQVNMCHCKLSSANSLKQREKLFLEG